MHGLLGQLDATHCCTVLKGFLAELSDEAAAVTFVLYQLAHLSLSSPWQDSKLEHLTKCQVTPNG